MTIDRAPWVRYLTPLTGSRAHYGDAIATVARGLYGSDPMPWQQHVAQLNTELLSDASWAYQLGVITVPRQAGKTFLRFPIAAHRCLAKPLSRCWYTAQTRQHARDTLVEEYGARWRRSPFSRLAKLRESQGSEGLYFTSSTSSSYRVFSPDEGGLDGKANELVDVDEAWKHNAITGAALDNSILPTFNTTGGQLVVVSTAGTAASAYLNDKVKAARAAHEAGLDHGTFIVELGLPLALAGDVRALLDHGPAGPKFDRAVQLLAEHNPAHGYTLRLDALANGVRAMMADPLQGVDGALRAYGNIPSVTAEVLIPAAIVTRTKVEPFPAVPARAALGVGVGLDGVDTALVAAWRDQAGRPHLATLAHVDGTLDGVAELREHATGRRWAARACAGEGPVLEVVDAAERAELRAGDRGRPFRVDRLAAKDYATACRQLLALFLAAVVAHDNDPAMVAALESVAKRTTLEGAWAWGRGASAASIATLEAATAALWAFDHAPELGMPGVHS